MTRRSATKPVIDLPFLTIRKCVPITGLSERYLRELLRNGELPHIKTGNRVLVNVRKLLDMMDEKTTTGENDQHVS